ncbi:MAG: DMT family transporter [Bacillota bacterium]
MAVFLFGLAGLFGKLVMLPAIIIVLGRVFFASLFLISISILRKQDIKLQESRDYFYLLIQGVMLVVHWWTFYQSIQVSTVAVGLLTFSTFPVFVAFLEPVVFKEKLKVKDILLAGITFFGVLFVVPELDVSNNMTQGALWGIASGFTFAILSILNRKYVKKYSSILIALYQDGVALIVLLPFLWLLKPVISLQDILLLGLLGIVFTGVSHTLFINSLTKIKARTASIIASLEPVYGIIFAFLLLGEMPKVKMVFGGLIILGTAFYSTVMKEEA